MEKKIIPTLLSGFELATFRSRVRRSNQQAILPDRKLYHLQGKFKVRNLDLYHIREREREIRIWMVWVGFIVSSNRESALPVTRHYKYVFKKNINWFLSHFTECTTPHFCQSSESVSHISIEYTLYFCLSLVSICHFSEHNLHFWVLSVSSVGVSYISPSFWWPYPG